MKVIMLSTDRKILEEGSAVRARMIEYGGLVDELHIIAFSTRIRNQGLGIRNEKIAENLFVYSTNSLSRWFYIFDAIRTGKKIITKPYTLTPIPWLITAQDPFEVGFAGWRIARAFGAKLQIQIHTDFLSPYFAQESILNKIRVLMAKFLLPRADCIRAVSERIKNSLLAIGYKLSTITVLPIFIDAEKIKNTPLSFNLRQKYPQFDFIILMVSRLSKEKNIGLAIDAMKEIVKKHPKTGLIVVGSGPEESSQRSKAKGQRLDDNVVFEGWQSDTISYYKTADVFLNTSSYEGYGLSLAEAAISGCPIITTDVGIAPELKENGAKISICPMGNKTCITENIIKNISQPRGANLPWNPPTSLVESNKSEYLKKHTTSWQKCQGLV